MKRDKLGVDDWKPNPALLAAPIYKTLADQIIQAIMDGRLPNGVRLLPQRRMADDLNISIQTVSRAYEDLIRRGFLSGEAGRGTFVKRPPIDRGPPFTLQRVPDLIDLSILKPVCEDIHEKSMSAQLAALATNLAARAVHAFRPESPGSHHRAAALRWLHLCGVETSPYNVCVTNGATSAMAVALMTVAPPGSAIAMENLGHHSLRPLASYLGIRLVSIDTDSDGLLPAKFEEACHRSTISALMIQPSVINPASTLLPEARRRQIVEIAERHNVIIIENDSLGPLISDKPPTLFELAPDRTFYITSFTKIVMPGLRIGYLAIPSKYITTATNRHLVTNWMATPLMEEIATTWVEDDTAMMLVRWQQQSLKDRHRIFERFLGSYPHSTHPNSLHVWLPLPDGLDEGAFVAQARSLGVAVARASSFLTVDEPLHPAVRISLGSVNTRLLEAGLDTIANILRSPAEAPLMGP